MSSTNFTWCIIEYFVPSLLKKVVLSLFFQKIYLELYPDSVQIFTVLLNKKWSFPLRISSVKCPNPQFPVDLVRFTELILNGKLQLLFGVSWKYGFSNDMIYRYFPTDTYMFKVNDESSRKRCGLCLKLVIKTRERPSCWCFYC